MSHFEDRQKKQQADVASGKRIKKSKADITSQRIFEESLKAFQKKGFDETTMRDLAEVCGLSPGAFYYHFKSKEEIIQVFYRHSFADFAVAARKRLNESKGAENGLANVIKARLDTFAGYRELLIVLSRSAVDPKSDLSPFSAGTAEIRNATIGLMKEVIEASDLKFDSRLEPYLPALFWMYLMGIVFFWVFDESENQGKTYELVDRLTPLVLKLVRMSRLPMTGPVLNPILATLKLVMPK